MYLYLIFIYFLISKNNHKIRSGWKCLRISSNFCFTFLARIYIPFMGYFILANEMLNANIMIELKREWVKKK